MDPKHKNEMLEKNSKISHYRVLEKLGAGGMGEVYLAEDTRLDRKVAVKFLQEELSRDADKLNRFIQEAKAVSVLNHPNILTIHEIGEYQGKNYIVTELIDGVPLSEPAKNNSLSVNAVLEIAVQIASALGEAHSAGIVHRDIKPDNVMIRRKDKIVKVLDFGLAKLVEPKQIGQEHSTLVQSNPGVIRGTVAYMSPEQARGLKLDHRTDIWSFGVVLYEMLAGRLPFTGETATDVMFSIIQREPPALQNIAPDLPQELYFIVNKLLRKKLDERYQNISDALNDLRRVKQRLDYEEIERTLSPEDSRARIVREERGTAIFEAVSSDSRDSISSSSSTEHMPPNNLSAELAPLIGRDAELKEIAALLAQNDVRLLTVTGVGGTGKTRLAQAVAHHGLADFSDGVYFINLAAIETPELVVPVIAQTLGVREESGKSLKEKLREFFQERKILLVLDNFEQIAQAAPQIGELLSGSRNLKILVTSRVRLYLRFEHEFPLQPLEVPAQAGRLSVDELRGNPAMQMFIERAQAVKPAFALTEENAQSIAEICRRLDGLPLAIELAAARVKLLAPQAILSRLASLLKILTGGAKDLPARQQTMRAAIQWSFDLLEPDEQKLFARLAVFAGGFTLDAAEAVAVASEDLQIDLFDGIASLVDKSLLHQRETKDGEPRFRMLAVVREFTLEQLEASGEAQEIRRRHAKLFAGLSEEAYSELTGAQAGEWYERLEEEHDNLRLALEWSLVHEPETALRVVAGIWRFWDRRGYLAEGAQWITQTLARTEDTTHLRLRAIALTGISYLSRNQGDLQAAEKYGAEGVQAARASGDEAVLAGTINALGNAKQYLGEHEAARALLEEGLERARAAGDKWLIAALTNNLGIVAHGLEDYAAARKYYEEFYALAKAASMPALLGTAAANLAETLCLLEEYEAARRYALESLDVCEKLGDKIRTAFALIRLGALAAASGRMERAARLFGAAQALFESKGYKINEDEQRFLARYEAKARAALGDETYEAAYAEGQQMRLKKIVALARESD